MKREILICDRCSRGYDDGIFVKSYRINNGKEIDPSGNGYIIDWKYKELCEDCYDLEAMRVGKDNIQKA
jgi:hypothetical protein